MQLSIEHFRFVLCPALALSLISLAPGATPTKKNLNELQEEEHQILENIRYTYDIEGDLKTSIAKLKALIQRSTNPNILSKANFFLGKIYDRDLSTDSAVAFYEKALNQPGLSKGKLAYLYERLANLKPELVESVSLKTGSISRIDRTFSYLANGNREYVLQVHYHEKNPTDFHRQFARLDAKGKLERITIQLEKYERLYDISSDFYIAGKESELRIASLSGDQEYTIDFKDDLIASHILASKTQEFVVHYSNHLDYFKQGSFKRTIPIEDSKCEWHPVKQSMHSGIMHCNDSLLYLIDVATGSLKELPPLPGIAYFVEAGKNTAVIQFFDHFEVRSGKLFSKTLWTGSSSLADKIYLTKSYLYTLDGKGMVSCYNLTSGRKRWQKEFEAKMLFPTDKEIYLITHYHSCLGVGADGDINWTYEFGRDAEISPFLLNGHMVLFYKNGRRIDLNLDFMKIFNKTSNTKLRNLIDNPTLLEAKSGLKYAENVLRLAPGNGLAWHYKYLCLKQINYSPSSILKALRHAAHSRHTPAWEFSPILNALNSVLNSQWIWKRAYGQKYFPTLVPEKKRLLYIENNNQTLVVLGSSAGKLLESVHIPEQLDSKICMWLEDNIIVSSPKNLYLVPSDKGSSSTKSFALAKPVCSSIIYDNMLILSDWFGNLRSIQIPQGFKNGFSWSKQVSKNGLLINQPPEQTYLDITDIQGSYFAINPLDGRELFHTVLPQGIITDVYSQIDRIFMGYDNGLLISLDKKSRKIIWSKNLPDQIFSLDGDGKNMLVLTTSAREVFCIDAGSGKTYNKSVINTSVVNKPGTGSGKKGLQSPYHKKV
jgi:outer membrane protein assembly factor BamB